MKLRYKIRTLARDLRRFPRDLWHVVRRWWWIARGERQRMLQENENLREWNDVRFAQYREARDAVFELQVDHRGASIDVLRAVADEIDCGPGCEECSPMDMSTGIVECRLSDRGECPNDKAWQLRNLAAALETHAAMTSQAKAP